LKLALIVRGSSAGAAPVLRCSAPPNAPVTIAAMSKIRTTLLLRIGPQERGEHL